MFLSCEIKKKIYIYIYKYTHTQPEVKGKRARDLVEATPTWSDFEAIWGASSVHDHYYKKSEHTNRSDSLIHGGTPMPTILDAQPNSAAAAKSLPSCPTLCDPTDGSPPGSPIPGILQARTVEWVAISFSSA